MCNAIVRVPNVVGTMADIAADIMRAGSPFAIHPPIGGTAVTVGVIARDTLLSMPAPAVRPILTVVAPLRGPILTMIASLGRAFLPVAPTLRRVFLTIAAALRAAFLAVVVVLACLTVAASLLTGFAIATAILASMLIALLCFGSTFGARSRSHGGQSGNRHRGSQCGKAARFQEFCELHCNISLC